MESWNDAPQILKTLSDALDAYDWPTANTICDSLINRLNVAMAPFPEGFAKAILNSLRRKRQFHRIELVADAFVRSGQTAPQIYRQYAQALIDQGSLTAAMAILNSIVSDPSTSAAERAEANGLQGRVLKQLYVNAGDPSNPRQQTNLRQAIQRYLDVYETDPNTFYWQGINTVALMLRAVRDGVEVLTPVSSGEIISQLRGILGKDELNRWERATCIEIAVASGDPRSAYDHAILFVSDPSADAFEIASLLRQLTQVWQLSADKEPGNNLIPLLKAALLKREGGELSVRGSDISGEKQQAQNAQRGLERVFGKDRYQPLEWYKTGLSRCAGVGRVETLTGQKIGSGFLVTARDFFSERNDNELLFVTNAHVLSPPDSPVAGSIPPSAAVLRFEANETSCKVGDLLWSSPPGALDASFVTIRDRLAESTEACPLVPPAAPFDSSGHQRVYVIGYPLGGGLSFSLQDSIWLDTDGKVLHYRTPTEPGSSGSPVFDQDYWTVIGLHHVGRTDMPRLNGQSGTYEANEAISIGAIQKATRATPVGFSAAGG